ncbi:MAG: hypothetical protein GWP06_12515, partial [Actinobacteria bacterium]|nr:hypothetical protein [Actinomycetota bacterium]
MENNKKRLLKDLPFGNLNKDIVLHKANDSYQVNGGETYYSSGGNSNNGCEVCNEKEKEIIDMIWDNSDWFEIADLKHIDIIPKTTEIIIRFEPIDIEDVESFAKGIIHILPEL